MVNQIPVPQAKYELLTDVRQPRRKCQVLLLSLLLASAGALLLSRAWTGPTGAPDRPDALGAPNGHRKIQTLDVSQRINALETLGVSNEHDKPETLGVSDEHDKLQALGVSNEHDKPETLGVSDERRTVDVSQRINGIGTLGVSNEHDKLETLGVSNEHDKPETLGVSDGFNRLGVSNEHDKLKRLGASNEYDKPETLGVSDGFDRLGVSNEHDKPETLGVSNERRTVDVSRRLSRVDALGVSDGFDRLGGSNGDDKLEALGASSGLSTPDDSQRLDRLRTLGVANRLNTPDDSHSLDRLDRLDDSHSLDDSQRLDKPETPGVSNGHNKPETLGVANRLSALGVSQGLNSPDDSQRLDRVRTLGAPNRLSALGVSQGLDKPETLGVANRLSTLGVSNEHDKPETPRVANRLSALGVSQGLNSPDDSQRLEASDAAKGLDSGEGFEGVEGVEEGEEGEEGQDAKVAAWLRRARMYAESAKENQSADRNTSVGPGRRHNGTRPDRQILVCYYTVPGGLSVGQAAEPGPSRLDAALCTHIIVAFASVVNASLVLPGDDALLREVARLRTRNPELRIMLSAGGSSEVSEGFGAMVKSHATRKRFIRSFLNASRVYGFDGLDLDWEFPGWLGADERERMRFAQLLQELRREFDRASRASRSSRHAGRRLLLSVAVAAPQAIVDQSYIIPDMAQQVDFVNLMSYDYHFYVWYYPVTGLNSALFARAADSGYLSTLNVNFSAEYWTSRGMPREKLVIGVPAYGHSYRLDNARNHGIGAPASGFGRLGRSGFVDFASTCGFLAAGARRVFESDGKVPYAYRGKEWISYDDRTSVAYKAEWIRASGFGGAMILSLNVDDWAGGCFNETFPLTRVVARTFNIQQDAEGRSL